MNGSGNKRVENGDSTPRRVIADVQAACGGLNAELSREPGVAAAGDPNQRWSRPGVHDQAAQLGVLLLTLVVRKVGKAIATEGIRMRRFKRVRFSIKSLLAFITGVAMLLTIWPILQDHFTRRILLASVDHRFIDVQDLRSGSSQRQPNEERIGAAVDRVKRRNLENSVVNALMNTLTHGNEEAQIHAAMALRQLGPVASDAVPALTRVLEDRSDVALQAARALGSIGNGSEDGAGKLLSRQFCDKQLRIDQRVAAAEALIEIGQTSRLIEMMIEDDAVCLGLQAMFCGFQRPHVADDVPVAVTYLTDELSNKHQLNRQFAAWTLGAIGPGAADSIPVLRVAQQDSCTDVRRAATRAIAQISAVPNRRMRPRQ